MRPALFTGICLAFLSLTGCTDQASELRSAQQAYFDVPGFINAQTAALEKEPQSLEKTVGFEGKNPETQTLNQPDWNTELALFREIDLNKKALSGLYTETKTLGSEGEKVLYTLNDAGAAPIVLLEIRKNQQDQVTHLKAVYEQKNALFYNRETRTLQTDQGKSLKTYQVTGVQKVLLFDSLAYRVSGMLP